MNILSIKLFIMSLTDPVCWIIDKSAESILDVGCGRGLPMRKIRSRMSVKYAVGVDIFKPYLTECRKKGLHNKYILSDVKKMSFKSNSFDVVIALQILEHLSKKDAWKVLTNLEKIARKQVIVAMPIGECFHSEKDHNIHQLHKSSFYPSELAKKGYKTIKVGRKGLLGEEGLEGKFKNDIIKQVIYFMNMLIEVVLFIFPSFSNYYFVAYKNLDKK